MSKRFTPLPAPGDFVWCRFPEIFGTPGPKARPALVIAVFDADGKIRVCYGTSQKIDKLYNGEFVMDPTDDGFHLSGLGARTKFDLNKTFDLPFTGEWFAEHRGILLSSPPPKMGTLHSSYMQDVHRALGRS